MNNILILIIVVLVVLSYFLNNREHFATDLEAISNIASVYNTDQMKLTNLDVTQNLNVGSFNLLPRGCVIAWYGGATAPTGWVLCDGKNGTPDLRSRFIVGAGQGDGLSNYGVNATGGAESVTLTPAQMPSHTHGLRIDNACFKNGGCDNRQSLNFGNGPGQNTEAVGGNQAHENRPPFFALAYIMKT